VSDEEGGVGLLFDNDSDKASFLASLNWFNTPDKFKRDTDVLERNLNFFNNVRVKGHITEDDGREGSGLGFGGVNFRLASYPDFNWTAGKLGGREGLQK
jgi:hypothetical protein